MRRLKTEKIDVVSEIFTRPTGVLVETGLLFPRKMLVFGLVWKLMEYTNGHMLGAPMIRKF